MYIFIYIYLSIYLYIHTYVCTHIYSNSSHDSRQLGIRGILRWFKLVEQVPLPISLLFNFPSGRSPFSKLCFSNSDVTNGAASTD